MSSDPDDSPPGLRELLAFYAEAGVDDALVEEAPDRFAEAERAAAGRAQPRPPPPAGRGQLRDARASRAVAAAPPRPPQRAAVPDEAQARWRASGPRRRDTLDELRQHWPTSTAAT